MRQRKRERKRGEGEGKEGKGGACSTNKNRSRAPDSYRLEKEGRVAGVEMYKDFVDSELSQLSQCASHRIVVCSRKLTNND